MNGASVSWFDHLGVFLLFWRRSLGRVDSSTGRGLQRLAKKGYTILVEPLKGGTIGLHDDFRSMLVVRTSAEKR